MLCNADETCYFKNVSIKLYCIVGLLYFGNPKYSCTNALATIVPNNINISPSGDEQSMRFCSDICTHVPVTFMYCASIAPVDEYDQQEPH